MGTENNMISNTDMPAPDALVRHEDGTVVAAMFYYAAEYSDPFAIAQTNGFELRTLPMDGDDKELSAAYFAGDNSAVERWHPVIDGWALSFISTDGEDGPIAYFLRPRDA